MSDEQKMLKRALEKAGALVSTNKEGMVKAVQFVGKRTKDKHLELLAQATEIEKLILSYTSITDEGMIHLSELTKLRVLSLFRNDVTNKGMKHLSKLSKLKQLNLEATRINDGCIGILCTLSSLERISMDHESVTQKGEDALREALPDCQIYR